MKKQENTKKIIQQLLRENKITGFTRYDIDKAILKALWLNDQRSYDRWFEFLFKMDFIIQPQKDLYALNIEQIAKLEVELPEEVDPNQRRLSL